MENSNFFGNRKDGEPIAGIDPASIGSAPNAAASGSTESTGADPASGTGQSGNAPKRRGRPPGSKNKSQNSQARAALPLERDAISALLLSAHAMLAGITSIPELALDSSESAALADATAKLAELYDVQAAPKTVAWCNFGMALGMVYGTRFIAISARKKSERRKPKENVTPIRPGVNMGSSGVPQVTLPGWDTSPIGPDGKPTKQ